MTSDIVSVKELRTEARRLENRAERRRITRRVIATVPEKERDRIEELALLAQETEYSVEAIKLRIAASRLDYPINDQERRARR